MNPQADSSADLQDLPPRDVALQVVGAAKQFGRVQALRGVDLTVRKGEVHALLGDNGAGKSTLVKALAGVHRLDGGQIYVGGSPAEFKSPGDARDQGIETVYQDLSLFDNLDVLANMFMGREVTGARWLKAFGPLRTRAMAREWQAASKRLKITIPDPRQPIGLMSGGQRQAVAVARAAAFAREIVILDEPTAALGLRESRQVIDLIRSLPDHGVSVILISHNMADVISVADQATVLRQGSVVGTCEATKDNEHDIVSMIVGSQ